MLLLTAATFASLPAYAQPAGSPAASGAPLVRLGDAPFWLHDAASPPTAPLPLSGTYAMPLLSSGPYTPSALACSINTACSEGDGWSEEASAVVRIDLGGGYCTGVLLNNTQGDGTPYVLTANHCGNASVGQAVNWTFQFNYRSDTCSDPAETPTYDALTGGVVRAANAGYEDYTLVELNDPIPDAFGVSFAGWSIETAAPASGTVIGHPKADIQKITFDDDPIQNFSALFWRGEFDRGTIEGQSSGSPLFNQNHQFVGFVSLAEFMDPNACSGPGGDDNRARIYFPKLSYIWNDGADGQRISDFLDPGGTNPPNVPPLGPPSPIWINEVNAHGGAPENDEFVEIVGPPGTDLEGYALEVYTCSGGAAQLASTHPFSAFVLPNDYEEFGLFVLGGSGIDAADRDQTFGQSVLPDAHGVLVLKDDAGAELFRYQYDDGAYCPTGTTTRSAPDAPGLGTMGFTTNTRPSATAEGTNTLTATPGTSNFDGGQQLPVELTAFEAVVDGQAVLLRWETASETNNAGFEIERRGAGEPTDAWQAIDFVVGYGTTLEAQTYQHRVEALLPGRHVFRLKQIDYDGTFEYHPEIEVAVGIASSFTLSEAYPNPFNPETRFSLSVARRQHVTVAAYDMVGRRVATLFDGVMDDATSRTFVFEAAALPSGVYLIHARGERFMTHQRVALVK
ncbi:MAG: trypsin-like peptidase domain-containing protein [Rhodothermales bacterium]|nr:trypsin-like peptidase domain-containing protein [Rhodothermales bacterium]